ncbi:MAG: ligase-associated DNA damage response endonuclease PdeM [Rhizobiales bacterium]|nr:ligase-associated DNA damage response endonuclease PdeM [Hyphomicrobiales bacterium]
MRYSPRPPISSSTRPCGLSRTQRIALGGLDFIPDLSGALYVPEFDTLIVADLHLEKASSIARRGVHLPPYDTRATLAQLALAIEASNPRRLIFLGDSFHDSDAGSRIAREDVETLSALLTDREAIWVIGNHDPVPPANLCTRVAEHVLLGPVLLRHAPGLLEAGLHEIAGHLHPAAAVAQRGHSIRCKCFIGDGTRLVMPAFGSFTGGLSISAEPFIALFPSGEYAVWMLGSRAVHRFPAKRVS